MAKQLDDSMTAALDLDAQAQRFVELLLEGKESPAQLALVQTAPSAEAEAAAQAVITADMEWWANLLGLAFRMGRAAATDKRGRRTVRK